MLVPMGFELHEKNASGYLSTKDPKVVLKEKPSVFGFFVEYYYECKTSLLSQIDSSI